MCIGNEVTSAVQYTIYFFVSLSSKRLAIVFRFWEENGRSCPFLVAVYSNFNKTLLAFSL